jgi:hypothetical protein
MGSEDHYPPRPVRRLVHCTRCESLADRSRYIVAKLFKPLLGCSTASLRALNIAAICLICLVSYSILRTLRTPRSQNAPLNVKDGDKEPDLNDSTLILDANTALNIALFPPLFFFSALFYTDVMSTLVVLLSFHMFLTRSTFGNLLQSIGTIFIGVVALFFRQTNIFWVAVFPAGLAVIDTLKASAPSSTSKKPQIIGDILRESWNNGIVHDCALQDASLRGTNVLIIYMTPPALTRARLWSVGRHCCNGSNEESSIGPTGCLTLPCSSCFVRKFCDLERKCCSRYVRSSEGLLSESRVDT